MNSLNIAGAQLAKLHVGGLHPMSLMRRDYLGSMMEREEGTTKCAKGAKREANILFKDESYKIAGGCFEVYKEKGNGFLEAVYQECLALEFKEQGIPFIEKPLLRLDYKGRELKQTYASDFLCFDAVIVEIKAVKKLADEHRAQAINYLKATGKQLGLWVNFGHYPKLEHERFVNQSLS
jgi:GxxExxY protein